MPFSETASFWVARFCRVPKHYGCEDDRRYTKHLLGFDILSFHYRAPTSRATSNANHPIYTLGLYTRHSWWWDPSTLFSKPCTQRVRRAPCREGLIQDRSRVSIGCASFSHLTRPTEQEALIFAIVSRSIVRKAENFQPKLHTVYPTIYRCIRSHPIPMSYTAVIHPSRAHFVDHTPDTAPS